MKLIDTLILNRAISINNQRDPKTIKTIPRSSIFINMNLIAIQLTNFFLIEEARLIIEYANSRGFKGLHGESKPTVVKFISSNFAKIMEMRLTEIGLIPQEVQMNNKRYKFSRVHPEITIVMQIPGDKPDFYEPTDKTNGSEMVTMSCIGYLDALGKGKTNIYKKNKPEPIDSIMHQLNTSLFVFDSRNLKIKESITTQSKYYLYFDILYVDDTLPKLTDSPKEY